MKKRFACLAAAAALAAPMALLPARAGVKYWDDPEFRAYDVGDYVQDGLVVNYDGIRNAGPGKDHDPDATTWVNAANPGTYDMTRYSLVNGAWVEGAAKGYWTATGFVFAKNAVFDESDAFTVPVSFTHQVLVDATSAAQSGIGYPVCGSSETSASSSSPQNWNYGMAVGIRSTGTISHSMYFCPFNAGTSARPALSGTSFTYGTAILDGSDAVMFDGISAPWSASAAGGTTGHYKPSSYSPVERTCQYGISLGGHYKRTDELFSGTLRTYRFYKKALSDEEVAWNRVVDEARFFHRRAAIPVTNVVVAVTIDGVEDNHFALDDDGFTFTAPTSRAVEGKRHVLSGYTLETWNGSAWTGATTGSGSSVTISDASAKVRLTWNYAPAADEGRLAHYDVSDYVTDGLLLFYDGILNQGVGKEHSYSATDWVNIGNGDGQDWTLSLAHKVTSGDPGAWDSDGYVFKGYSDFQKMGLDSIPHPSTHSIQTLIDASVDEQVYGTCAYLYATAYTQSSFALRTTGDTPKVDSFYWIAQDDKVGRPYFLNASKRYDYATAIQDGSANTLAFFAGMDVPASGAGVIQLDAAPAEYTAKNIFLGGYNNNSSLFAGKMKFFRYYADKALTPAEVLQNRKVDEYRYFGRYVVTNVLVQSTYSCLQGNEPDGPYEVVDSYTFTAPETATAANGTTYACAGYTLDTWDGTDWVSDGKTYESSSCKYTTSSGLQRLTWIWKPVRGIRTAADYGFDDLSQAGLALHYDGKFNAGVGTHSATATKWANLGSAGAAYDAVGANVGSGARGNWTDDGYFFTEGGYRFVTPTSPTFRRSPTYTLQTLVDAPAADNAYASGNFIVAGGWDTSAMAIYGDSGDSTSQRTVTFHTQAAAYADRPRLKIDGDSFTFGTAILDGAKRTAVVFTGVEPPSSGTVATGFKQFDGDLKGYDSRVFIASWNSTSDTNGRDRYLRGTVKSIRHYDRVLTDEELVRNRNVDAARYFGALGVTNLVVEVEEDSAIAASPAAGAYYVEGSWDFEATLGDSSATVGWKLQDWDETAQAWTNSRLGDSGSFSWTAAGATAAKQRLLWREIKPFVLVVR